MATNNITLQRGASGWYSGVGNLYEDDLLNWVNLNNYQSINDMQHRHSLLYHDNNLVDSNGNVLAHVSKNSNVGAYQTDIRESQNGAWNVVNTKGINNGYTTDANGNLIMGTNRYGTISRKPDSNDSAAAGWRTDNYYGAETDDRRLFGRISRLGVDDYTPDQLQAINVKLKNKGLELYLDTSDNYYKLRPLQEENPPEQDHPGGNPPGVNPPGQTPPGKTYIPTIPKVSGKKLKYPGWTDWIPLTMNNMIDKIANTRTYLNETLKRFPRLQAPYIQAKVTDAYAHRQQLNQSAQDVRFRGTQNLSSDLQANIKQRLAYESEANKYDNEAIRAKANEFAATTKNVQDVANKNILTGSQYANENAKSDAAAWNNILNARNARIARDKAADQKYITDMYTNFGEYLKTKRLNIAGRTKRLAKAEFDNAIADASKPYSDLRNNRQKWNQLSNFAFELAKDPELTSTDTSNETFKQILTAAQQNKLPQLLQDPKIQAYLLDKLDNGDTTTTRKYRQMYYNDLENSRISGETAIKKAQGVYNNKLADVWTYETNQWGLPTNINSRFFKKGGKVDTLMDFVNDYRKEAISVRENAQKRNHQISQNLNEELRRLNQEELLLLRAVFK